MIRAAKSKIAEALFSRYNTRILKRHFHRLMLAGMDRLTELDRSSPIVFYANHTNWWDGLVALFLSREILRVDQFAMMEERQLARYKFFRWIGAFSVDRESPRSAMESIQYARGVLNAPNRALWIYPQGEMKPNDARPLAFQHGITRLADLDRVQFVPVAHRYEFVMQQRPECFTEFGEVVRLPDHLRNAEIVTGLEQKLTGLLDSLRCALVGGDYSRFACVLSGKTSVNVRYDRTLLRSEGR